MSEISLLPKSPLVNAEAGLFGAQRTDDAGVVLSADADRMILQVLGASGTSAVPETIALWAGDEPLAVRDNGPGNWIVVCSDRRPPSDVAELSDRLEGQATVVDQSHGRTLIKVSGSKVERMLASGVALDLHMDHFAPGTSATTLVGHITVLLTRTGEHSFELAVLSSFVQSLWDSLITMSRPFGVDARPA
ncbi:sarcosine oxidase subunit gamma family protein [Roseibium sp.]|uniref:sarcosine oxidase subunit gamma family protein n=1 Tax=Roseibium sp. TaxID=1936156 RepID=UPI003A97DE34